VDKTVRLNGISKKMGWPKPGQVNPKVLKMAIKIEMEHTDNPKIAQNIGLDHIAEYGEEYYHELIKMEKRLKRMKLGTVGKGTILMGR